MKKRLLLTGIILVIIAGFVVGANAYKPETPQVTQAPVRVVKTPEKAPEKPTPPTRDELLKLVNEERAKVGVAPLVIDDRLNWSAQKKADDMREYGYFGHVSPERSPYAGMHGYMFIGETDAGCVVGSENIRWTPIDNTTTVSVVNGWVDSEPHYKSMTSQDYSITGISIATDETSEKHYFVQHFCQS